METMTLNEKEIETAKNDDVLVIILLNKNFNFDGNYTPYDIEMCGKKMWEWVSLVASDYKVKTTVCTEESNILSLIKPYLENQKYTAVLYSDTPLLSGATFNDIITYAKSKETNVLTLSRGYVFNTEYIKNVDSLISNNITEFGFRNDFFVVSDTKKLVEAQNIIKNRIIDFHLSNGIIIEDRNSTNISADVIIEKGTVIKANNNISGLTFIGKNCILEPNNIIVDSVISNNSKIICSYIKESRISENMIVGPFESVVDKSN